MIYLIKLYSNFVKSSNSSKSIGFLTFLLGAKPSYWSSCLIWFLSTPKSAWPLLFSLACSYWWLPPCCFSSSWEDKAGSLFVHLVGAGVGELSCWFFAFLPILHLPLKRLVVFFMAYKINHNFSLIKFLHFFDGVILMGLGELRLAFLFLSSPSWGEPLLVWATHSSLQIPLSMFLQ